MRDVFYTILVVWIIWRIMDSVNAYANRRGKNTADTYTQDNREEGKTTIKHSPPVHKKINDDEGEYVDFEEIK